jgi:2-polyprenyl-3-methyl-5-hydroxy-6-metoxy-1,4-benzoquinol methylase
MIFGEKDSLADTMKECMSVITKPGFSTVAEAYAAGRAIFLVPGMPVAEDHNADYAIKNYGALWFNNEAFADWYHLRYTADKKIDKNIACPICSSAEYKNVLYDYDRLTHVPGAYHVLRCAGCDLYYVNPRYLKEGIPDLYPDSYFSKSKMRLFLLSIYDSLKKSIAIKILWRCVLSRLRITGEIDLGTIRLGPGSKVLDIGCATGTFLSHIHWLTGCKVNGIELNNAARLEANGKLGENAVFADLFEEKRLLEGSFDLVTMFFVIEHLHEPAAYMAKISALLKDDGWLVISLPNRDSLFFSAFGRRWSCLHLPQHFQFFSLPVLARFLNKNGFEIKAVKHSSNTRTLIASLQIIFYGKRFIPGRDKKAPFTQDNILLKFLLWPVCFVCACLGRSDTMYIYARKTDRKK